MDIRQYIDKQLDIEISGNKLLSGRLVDFGLDILVIFNGVNFLYIPLTHVQHIKNNLNINTNISSPSISPIEKEKQISYRKILNNAKGIFIEIYVSGNQSMHGYLTNILTDYLVFYSPVYKTMFIPLNHLKWLIPYSQNQTPYSLDRLSLPLNPSDIALARTFEEQLKKLEGKIVVFDIGINPNKIGLLKKVENNFIELKTAEKNSLFCNIRHLKTLHSPDI